MLEVIRRPTKTFKVLGWRWIVERTFGWLNWQRKLSKDYEYLPPNEKHGFIWLVLGLTSMNQLKFTILREKSMFLKINDLLEISVICFFEIDHNLYKNANKPF